MEKFIRRLRIEYPIPEQLSIWGGDGVSTHPLVDIKSLIETSIDEVSSDILMTSYIEATGMSTRMPDNTVTVSSAVMSSGIPFQGNRLVKVSYDAAKKIAFLRFYPATITYKRKLEVTDLDNLTGDRLLYIKSYILWKMADKELAVLKTVNLNVDNGTIDLSVLTEFRNDMKSRYESKKEDILIYSTSN